MIKTDRITCKSAYESGKTIFLGYLDDMMEYNPNEENAPSFGDAESEAEEWYWNKVDYYIEDGDPNYIKDTDPFGKVLEILGTDEGAMLAIIHDLDKWLGEENGIKAHLFRTILENLPRLDLRTYSTELYEAVETYWHGLSDVERNGYETMWKGR